jgi:transcriptional regulator with XRE-family HTH domain
MDTDMDLGPDLERTEPRGRRDAREPLWRDLIGGVLRSERQAQERTLQDVADSARISMPYLSELERGRKEASSEILAAAAQALGLRLSDLISLAHSRLGEYEKLTAAAASRPSFGVANRDSLCLAA